MQPNTSNKLYLYWKFHPVTTTLILLNFMMVVVLIIDGGFSLANLVAYGAIFPPLIIEDNQWYRLVTAMFLHGNVFHFLMNSLFLYYLGSHLERLIGGFRYGIMYMIAGIMSSLSVLYLGDYGVVTIGASGSLFGIIGGLLLLTFVKRTWFTPQSIKSIRQLVIINLIITFAIPNISTPGHLGGLITGLTLFYFFIPDEPAFHKKIKTLQDMMDASQKKDDDLS